MIRRILQIVAPAVVVALPVFAGCSAQVEPTYRGEPLAVIQGTIVTEGREAPSDIDVAVLWFGSMKGPGWEPKLVGTKIPVQGSFPARFTLSLIEPPPDDAKLIIPLGPQEGQWYWQGMVVALRSGADGRNLRPSDILGIDTQHLLFYYDGTAALYPGDLTARNPGGLEPEGYRLVGGDLATREAVSASMKCIHGTVCVHRTEEGASEWLQLQLDANYERCKAYIPEAESCDLVSGPDATPDSIESDPCFERWQEALAKSRVEAGLQPGARCSDLLGIEPAREVSFEDPLTIRLGTNMWDLGTSTID